MIEMTDEEFIELIMNEEMTYEEKLPYIEGREDLLESILESTRVLLRNDGYHVENGYIYDGDGRIVLIRK